MGSLQVGEGVAFLSALTYLVCSFQPLSKCVYYVARVNWFVRAVVSVVGNCK